MLPPPRALLCSSPQGFSVVQPMPLPSSDEMAVLTRAGQGAALLEVVRHHMQASPAPARPPRMYPFMLARPHAPIPACMCMHACM